MHKRLFIAAALLALPLACTSATETATTSEKEQPAASPGKPLHPIQVEIVGSGLLKAGEENTAKLRVSSSRPVTSMEVSVTPQAAASGMVIMEDRFRRQGSDLVKGSLEVPLQFRPAVDGPQPVQVLVRATAPDGSVLSRSVVVSLGDPRAERAGKPPRNLDVPEDYSATEKDAVVEGKQELKRDN